MHQIIILRGNGGCGKTTASQMLQQALGRGTLLIPQDTARREMLYIKDRPNNLSVELMKQIIDFGYKNCEYTILEGILYADYYQGLFDHIQKLYGKQIHAYYFRAPFDTAFARQQARPLHNKYTVEKMREKWRDDDYLPNIKETVIDTLALNADEVVAKILADLGVQ